MAKNIGKVMNEIESTQEQLEKNKRRFRRMCDHQKNGEIFLEVIQKDGKTAWRCKKCKKIIDQKAPTDQEMDACLNQLETASDFMRMLADTSTEKGLRRCEWQADFLMDAEKFVKAYKQQRGEQQKKKDKRNKSRGSHGGAHYES